MTLSGTLLAALGAEIPVVPGADEARRWAAEELAKKAYQDAKPGLSQTILNWLGQALQELLAGMGSLPGSTGLLVVLGLALLAVVAAVVIIRPRLNRKKARDAFIFEGSTTQTAAEHRELARSAVERGDLGTALSEQFRAIVRAAEERRISTPSPGRTAAEVAADLRLAFPAHGQDLLRAAEIFNSVRYGRAEPALAQYQELVTTDKALTAAKPAHATEAVAP
ncbi:DUF4129 domain-containing protein [Arthrobacter sp. AQ5-05]|uniref:DUF4129 domain-containing protein n=1 Tax=Arthrobacter sp. AQ5-05 TaxID=2184581 RepID=UPI0012B54C60|nr:DUF4129 domain-containing protein [Arthrobacter sp. AQ5-05]